MSERANTIANLRHWLTLAPSSQLAEFLACLRDELSTRLNFDAANFVTRGIACLDERKVAERLRVPDQPPADVVE